MIEQIIAMLAAAILSTGVKLQCDSSIDTYIDTTSDTLLAYYDNSDWEDTYYEYDLPDVDTSFKAYMDYRTITDKTSEQWELQQIAETDDSGFRRIYDDYCIAVSSYYAEELCGSRLRITLEGDVVFTAIVGDIKNPDETDSLNMYHPVKNGANVIEFIVDTSVLNKEAVYHGDVSCLGFDGNIVKIERID